ncbi:hypothetical protein N8148_02760 [Gammaproteobacteria bacterium]|nr:hypothetical protein [Gammaproteobacteria bacterium]
MAIPRISAKFETTLALKVNVGDLTGTLTSVEDADGVALANGTYGFTVDEGNSDFGYFEATVTGTALTNVVSFSSTALTETAGFSKAHRAGAEIKITDFTILGHLTGIFRGTEDLDSSVAIKYDAAPTLSDSNALATVQYVLDNITGGAVTFNKQVIAGVAGETLTIGDWIYFKESDGRWWKTDANTKATCVDVRIGKALGAGTTGAAITTGVFLSGIETTGSYVAGTKYYLSNTAGALSTSVGENTVLVGIGDDNADMLFVNLYDPEAVTQDEKDALVGTSGSPSTDNKFVTADNTSAAGSSESQTTDDTTIEVGETDATTNKVKIAQSFKATRSKVRGVALKLAAMSGEFVGTVEVSIQADDGAGDPDGSDLVTVTEAFANHNETNEHEFEFATEYTAIDPSSDDNYWVVVETSTTDSTNHPNFRSNSAGGYTDGELKYWNTTDGWTAISGNDLWFKILDGVTDQVVTTDTTLGIPREMYGLTEMPTPMFYQPFTNNSPTTTVTSTNWTASNEDGSVIFANVSTTGHRFERDDKTGTYTWTHTATTSAAGTTGTNVDNGSAAVLGDYLYVAGYKTSPTPDEWGVVRYDLADFTNQTEMTIPVITVGVSSSTERRQIWTDGTYLYMQFFNSTTVYKFKVDGTTLTTVDTGTIHADLDSATNMALTFNGKGIYRAQISGSGTYTVVKASDSYFNTYTTVGTYNVYEHADSDIDADNAPIFMFVDEDRFLSLGSIVAKASCRTWYCRPISRASSALFCVSLASACVAENCWLRVRPLSEALGAAAARRFPSESYRDCPADSENPLLSCAYSFCTAW